MRHQAGDKIACPTKVAYDFSCMKPFLGSFIALVASISATAQVTIDVVATNKAGIVRDLTAKDFKVFEDNKEQPVSGAALEPAGKRAIVLLFDNTTVSIRNQGDVRGYVERFIDASAGPNVYMEVANYITDIKVLQPFTTDGKLLKASLAGTAASSVLNSSQAGGGSASASAGGGRAGGGGGRSSVRDGSGIASGGASPENSMKSQAMMESLRGLVESMASIKGRKALILFSGGQSFSQDATVQVNAALDAANKANVAIYGIAASDDNSGMAFAKTFADATGGTAMKATPSLPETLHQILQEQDAYYSVTFTPASGGDAPGACHQLRIKAETSGVDVRARKLYCESRGDGLAGSAVGKDLDTKLAGSAAGSLGTSVRAPWFYNGASTRVRIVMDVPAPGLKAQKEKGKFRAVVNVAGGAYRADGSVAAHFSEAVTEEFADQKQADAFSKQPFHYERDFTVPPGSYTVKAVVSPSADAWGKAETPLAIAAYEPGKFAMSGIALSRELRNAAGGVAGLPADMIEGETPLLASGHQVVPTSITRFHLGERALFYTEVYEPSLAGASPAGVSMDFRVVDRSSGAVKSDSGAANVAGYVQAGNPVIGVASTVPVAGLTAGAYRLELTATHTSGAEAILRAVDFDLY